jgi:enamine deaminase RidA (YjgF/YER057c/UK114 family)
VYTVQRMNISSGSDFEGVYGYSRAVRVGDQIHVAGTTAPGDDAYVQARAVISIIEAALRETGASLADVVRTVTYVTDIGDTDLVTRAHHEAFGEIRPAATLVAVSALVHPSLRVEIEAYAIVPAEV